MADLRPRPEDPLLEALIDLARVVLRSEQDVDEEATPAPDEPAEAPA